MFGYARGAGTPVREAKIAQVDLLALDDDGSDSGDSAIATPKFDPQPQGTQFLDIVDAAPGTAGA